MISLDLIKERFNSIKQGEPSPRILKELQSLKLEIKKLEKSDYKTIKLYDEICLEIEYLNFAIGNPTMNLQTILHEELSNEFAIGTDAESSAKFTRSIDSDTSSIRSVSSAHSARIRQEMTELINTTTDESYSNEIFKIQKISNLGETKYGIFKCFHVTQWKDKKVIFCGSNRGYLILMSLNLNVIYKMKFENSVERVETTEDSILVETKGKQFYFYDKINFTPKKKLIGVANAFIYNNEIVTFVLGKGLFHGNTLFQRMAVLKVKFGKRGKDLVILSDSGLFIYDKSYKLVYQHSINQDFENFCFFSSSSHFIYSFGKSFFSLSRRNERFESEINTEITALSQLSDEYFLLFTSSKEVSAFRVEVDKIEILGSSAIEFDLMESNLIKRTYLYDTQRKNIYSCQPFNYSELTEMNGVSFGLEMYLQGQKQSNVVIYDHLRHSYLLRGVIEDLLIENIMDEPSMKDSVVTLIKIHSDIGAFYDKALNDGFVSNFVLDQFLLSLTDSAVSSLYLDWYVAALNDKSIRFCLLECAMIMEIVECVVLRQEFYELSLLEDSVTIYLGVILDYNIRNSDKEPIPVESLIKMSLASKLHKLYAFFQVYVLEDYSQAYEYLLASKKADIIFPFLTYLINYKLFPEIYIPVDGGLTIDKRKRKRLMEHIFGSCKNVLELIKLECDSFCSFCENMLQIDMHDESLRNLIWIRIEYIVEQRLTEPICTISLISLLTKYSPKTKHVDMLLEYSTNDKPYSSGTSTIEFALIRIYAKHPSYFQQKEIRNKIESNRYYSLLKMIYSAEGNYEKSIECLFLLDKEDEMYDQIDYLLQNKAKVRNLLNEFLLSKLGSLKDFKRLSAILVKYFWGDGLISKILLMKPESQFELLKEMMPSCYQNSWILSEKFIALCCEHDRNNVMEYLCQYTEAHKGTYSYDFILKKVIDYDLFECAIYIYERTKQYRQAVTYYLKKLRCFIIEGGKEVSFMVIYDVLLRNSYSEDMEEAFEYLFQGIINLQIDSEQGIPDFYKYMNCILFSSAKHEGLISKMEEVFSERNLKDEKVIVLIMRMLRILNQLSMIYQEVHKITRGDLLKFMKEYGKTLKKPITVTGTCGICNESIFEEIHDDLCIETFNEDLNTCSKQFKNFPKLYINSPVLDMYQIPSNIPQSAVGLIISFCCGHSFHASCALKCSRCLLVCFCCESYMPPLDLKRLKGKKKLEDESCNSFEDLQNHGQIAVEVGRGKYGHKIIEKYYLASALLSHPSRLSLSNGEYDFNKD